MLRLRPLGGGDQQIATLFLPLKVRAVRSAATRVLIADEVGLDKTVEALLIARELLDRAEIRRLTYVKSGMRTWPNKFNLSAEIVRHGTARRLERGLPAGRSIFDVVPFTVVSLGWIKSERNREGFLRSCGEFVIVDEAYTCAARKGGGKQQRYQLLWGLAEEDPDRGPPHPAAHRHAPQRRQGGLR